MAKERRCAEAEKKREADEVQAAKKAKDDLRQQQREAGNMVFFGSLNSKTKDDLIDITYTLRLTGPDSNMKETKVTQILMINTHLDNHPQLRSHPTVRTTSAEESSGEGLRRDAQNTSQAMTRE